MFAVSPQPAQPALPHVLVILASTRQGRFGEQVLSWLYPLVEQRTDLTAEQVDLRDVQQPYYDLPVSASLMPPEAEPQPWASMVGRADGFVIVTPEYNHGYPAVLKSALDAVYTEWNRKPVAFVSYGGWAGGARAVEQLRLVAVELQMAPVRNMIVLQFVNRLFDTNGNLTNAAFYASAATRLLDDLAWWARALKVARTPS